MKKRMPCAGLLSVAPDFVVNGLPRGKSSVEKFPNQFLCNFFNAFAEQYPWRDKAKSGLQCLNRFIGLRECE